MNDVQLVEVGACPLAVFHWILLSNDCRLKAVVQVGLHALSVLLNHLDIVLRSIEIDATNIFKGRGLLIVVKMLSLQHMMDSKVRVFLFVALANSNAISLSIVLGLLIVDTFTCLN